jgi:hypothetical protein
MAVVFNCGMTVYSIPPFQNTTDCADGVEPQLLFGLVMGRLYLSVIKLVNLKCCTFKSQQVLHNAQVKAVTKSA